MTDGIEFVADFITLAEVPGGGDRVSPLEIPHLCILSSTSTYLHIRKFFTYFHRFYFATLQINAVFLLMQSNLSYCIFAYT